MIRDTRFLHITDVHLTNPNQLLYEHIDTWQRLRAVLSAASHFTPDAVLLTGDIYNTGVPEHPEFGTLVAQARHDLGCPVMVLPGNHDNPDADHYRSTDAIAVGPEPGDSVYRIKDMRLITLNTHGQQAIQGHLTATQLEWLHSELQTDIASGTLLAMHHPPTPTTHQFLATVGLSNPSRLATVLQHSDVRLIASGHLHFPTASMLGTIPVWSGPALSYQHNAYAPAGTLQGMNTPGISVIDFFADTHAIVPVPLEHPTTLFSRPISNSPDRTPHRNTRSIR